MLRVGSCQVDLSSGLPITVDGEKKVIDESLILDPIYASSVAVDDGNVCILIISCDFISFRNPLVREVRNRIAEKTGLPPTNIILSATHNHNCFDVGFAQAEKNEPGVLDWLNIPKIQKQCTTDREALIERIVNSGVEAYKTKQPARMGYGKSEVEGCAFQRRFIMSNGRSQFNPRPGYNPDRLMAEGPVDKELQIVWFENLKGEILAIMLNFSSHPSLLYGTDWISSDYPGYSRRILQNEYGKDIPVLFLQGACGNVKAHPNEDYRPEISRMELMKRVGRILAGEAMKVISQNYAEEQETSVSVLWTSIELSYKDLTPETLEKAKAEYRDGLENNLKDIPFLTKVNWWSTFRLAEMRSMGPSRDIEMEVFTIGDLIFVTNPAEYFVEYQLEIKKRYSDKKIVFMELTNGACGYIPTRLAMALGGYETIQTKHNPDAGTLMMNASIALIEEITFKPSAECNNGKRSCC